MHSAVAHDQSCTRLCAEVTLEGACKVLNRVRVAPSGVKRLAYLLDPNPADQRNLTLLEYPDDLVEVSVRVAPRVPARRSQGSSYVTALYLTKDVVKREMRLTSLRKEGSLDLEKSVGHARDLAGVDDESNDHHEGRRCRIGGWDLEPAGLVNKTDVHSFRL